jgi:ribosomal protein S8
MQFGVIVLTTSAGIMVSPALCSMVTAVVMCDASPVLCGTVCMVPLCPFHCSLLIQDHEEARRKKVGGKVLGFFY